MKICRWWCPARLLTVGIVTSELVASVIHSLGNPHVDIYIGGLERRRTVRAAAPV